MFHFSQQGLELTRGTTWVALSPAGVGGGVLSVSGDGYVPSSRR